MAIPVVTQVNASPTTISAQVGIEWCRMNESMEAIVVAVSVPPTQIGLDSQYSTAVMAPAPLPNASLAHSYGPPSTGNVDPSSAVSIPYGIRKMISEITSQVMAWAPASAAAATLSRPTIAQAVNSTRSKRRSTLRSFAFSWATSVPSAPVAGETDSMPVMAAPTGRPGSC